VWQRDTRWSNSHGRLDLGLWIQVFDVGDHRQATTPRPVGPPRAGGQLRIPRAALVAIGGFDEFYVYIRTRPTSVSSRARRLHDPDTVPDNWIRHYSAGSEGRTPFDRNWRVIARSDTYFALKNGADRLPRRLARTIGAVRRIRTMRGTSSPGAGCSRDAGGSPSCASEAQASRAGLVGLARERTLGDFVPRPRVRSIPDRHRRAFVADRAAQPVHPGAAAERRRGTLHVRSRARTATSAGTPCTSSAGATSRSRREPRVHDPTHRSHEHPRGGEDRPVLSRNSGHALAVVRTLTQLERQGIVFDVVHASNWDRTGGRLIRSRIYRRSDARSPRWPRVMITEQWEATDDLRACVMLDDGRSSERTRLRSARGVLDTIGADGRSSRKRSTPPSRAPRHRAGHRRRRRVGRQRDGGFSSSDGARCGRESTRFLTVLPDLLASTRTGSAIWSGTTRCRSRVAARRKGAFLRAHRDAGWAIAVIFHGAVSDDDAPRTLPALRSVRRSVAVESFGLIYLEAMQYGKAVVGCRTGGIPRSRRGRRRRHARRADVRMTSARALATDGRRRASRAPGSAGGGASRAGDIIARWRRGWRRSTGDDRRGRREGAARRDHVRDELPSSPLAAGRFEGEWVSRRWRRSHVSDRKAGGSMSFSVPAGSTFIRALRMRGAAF
jgi:hypothetical protein